MRATAELMPLRVSCFGRGDQHVMNGYISCDVNAKGRIDKVPKHYIHLPEDRKADFIRWCCSMLVKAEWKVTR